jgi:Preprotein translocase subunit SecB
MQHRGEFMQNKDNIHSVLKLKNLVFDKIEFKRTGFQNDKELELKIQSNISQRQDAEIYKITLIMNGNKPDEYSFEISLTGFFTIEDDPNITQELKKDLVSKNAIAILMPYLRSEVSLLTAQPGVECVVLPAFNINKMLEKPDSY